MQAYREQGFAYAEVAATVVLLALCAIPAANAVKNALGAPQLALARQRELRCMQASMELVLSEPYRTLWEAARDFTQPTAYSQPADADCGRRDVYIVKYEAENGKAPVVLPWPDKDSEKNLEDVLLYVTVSSPDTSYSFSTLVAR